VARDISKVGALSRIVAVAFQTDRPPAHVSLHAAMAGGVTDRLWSVKKPYRRGEPETGSGKRENESSNVESETDH